MSEKKISQLEYDKAQLQEKLRDAHDANTQLMAENAGIREERHKLKMEIFRIEQRLFGVKEMMFIALGLIAGVCIGAKL